MKKTEVRTGVGRKERGEAPHKAREPKRGTRILDLAGAPRDRGRGEMG